MKDLSVCVVSWNTREMLRKCLASIYRYSDGLDIEVLVCDNASKDGTAHMVRDDFPQVRLLENERNIGYGRAINRAIMNTEGRFILLLNSDVLLVQPCLQAMIKFLEANSTAGCVSCKLLNSEGGVQKSFFEVFPTPVSELIQGLMMHRLFDKMSSGKSMKNRVVEVAWVVGASMMFRADLLKKLGGFDDRYYMYGEDVDMCYRIKKSGLKVYYMGEIEMLHHHAVSSRKAMRRYYAAVLQRESMYRFMTVHYGVGLALLYRLVWIASGLVRVSIISCAFLISVVFIGSRTKVFLRILEKYLKIVTWGLGFENWSRGETPE